MLETAPIPVPRRRIRARRRPRRDLFVYALIAPAALFMLLVHVVPTGAGVYMAFLDLDLYTFSRLFHAPFVGAMALALLLNRQFRGHRVLRTLMLAPWVVPSFVVAILWQFMWQSESGIVNKLLVDYSHGLEDKPVWLLGPHSLWAIVIPTIWRGMPFVTLVFLAGLQAIPRELNEAAAIDGANAWQRFRDVTVPLLRPLIAIQILFGVIYSVYQFALPYVMMGTNPGTYADLLMTLIVRQRSPTRPSATGRRSRRC
jgi:multiple sugar transport system permease protein